VCGDTRPGRPCDAGRRRRGWCARPFCMSSFRRAYPCSLRVGEPLATVRYEKVRIVYPRMAVPRRPRPRPRRRPVSNFVLLRFLRQSFPFNSRDVWVFIRYVTDCARLLLPSTARVPRETGWCGVAGQTLEFQVELTSSRGTARALAVHVICSLEWLCYIRFVLLRTQEGRLRPHFRSGGRQPRPAGREPLRRFRSGQVVRARGLAGCLRRQHLERPQVRAGFPLAVLRVPPRPRRVGSRLVGRPPLRRARRRLLRHLERPQVRAGFPLAVLRVPPRPRRVGSRLAPRVPRP